jgi:hypothetical protein
VWAHELNRRDGPHTFGVDDDGRVDAHAVLTMLHEVPPPQVSNVLLQLRACTLITQVNIIIDLFYFK